MRYATFISIVVTVLHFATVGAKDERTVPALRKATQDDVPRVRYNAFAALFKATRDYDEVLPFWLDLADGNYEFPEPDEQGREPDVYVDSVEKLHAAGTALRIRSLGREEPDRLGKGVLKLLSDKNPRLRRSAAAALGMLAADNLKSREALKKLAAQDTLKKLREDTDKTVRAAAENALHGFTKKVAYSKVPVHHGFVGPRDNLPLE